MPLPLSLATCLLIFIVVALVVNSWANVRLSLMDENVPVMDAVGSGTIHRENAEESSEQMFLKTHYAVNMTSCLTIFFDSRTLDPQKHRMGRLLLLDEPHPSFGTADGANEWAAAKTVCNLLLREVIMFELNWLRHLHKDLPMELGLHEFEVRNVLRQKWVEKVDGDLEILMAQVKAHKSALRGG